MKEDNSQFTIKPIKFYKSPFFLLPLFPSIPHNTFFYLIKEKQEASVEWVVSWGEVELNWTQKESAPFGTTAWQ